ncbi:MAG: DUF3488 domain-containing protein [Myxococcales bacterium]|nr:DUF3488 domain-containing protein [Myxococcales bacterium]
MQFDIVSKVIVYLLVTTSLAMIGLSGEIPLFFLFLVAVGAAVSWVWRPNPTGWVTLVWNAGLVLILVGLIFQSIVVGEWLTHAILFAMVMMLSKLFGGITARDYFQLYALTFLMVVSSAVLSPGIEFAVMFLVYTVLLTWALVLLHLRREAEVRAEQLTAISSGTGLDTTPVSMDLWKTRSILTPRFLVGTSVLALLIFASSAVIFFIFPRVGFGFLFGKGREGQSIAGFSNKVQLGHFGVIKNNPQVIARVEIVDSPDGLTEPLRLRGMSFDHYDGRVWSKKRIMGENRPMIQGRGGHRLTYDPEPYPGPTRTVVQRIYLEPLDTDVHAVFGQPRIDAVVLDQSAISALQGKARVLFQDTLSQDITFRGATDISLVYDVHSRIIPAIPSGIDNARAEFPSLVTDAYLQLPEQLNPNISKLATTIVRDVGDSPYDKAAAIRDYLLQNYTYSLQGGHNLGDPLASFLFERKAGHCEYFATALTILLRTVGVPARLVNGFFGGIWNPFGQYYEVRQGDAHAWVEVFIPGAGWLTFEPTPPSGALGPPDEGALSTLRRWLDSLKLSWYKWVVEYDLDKQLGVLRHIGQSLVHFGRELMPDSAGVSDNKERRMSLRELFSSLFDWKNFALIGGALVVFFLLIGFVRRLIAFLTQKRRVDPVSDDVRIVRQWWHQVIQLSSKAGVPITSSSTPEDILAMLATADLASDKAQKIATVYQEVRFGGRSLRPTERQELPRIVQAFKKRGTDALRARRRLHG